MSDAASPAKKAPAKKVTKKAPKPADHPKYADMIEAAVASLKDRKGSSRQAISKYIQANYKVADNSSVHVKTALKRGVASGTLVQVKGTGASGSFKLASKAAAKTEKKPAAKKPAAKKPAAKKPAKKTPKKAAKKPVAAKKSAKKTPKKAAKKSTPKKMPAKKAVVKKPAPKKAKAKKAKKAAKK